MKEDIKGIYKHFKGNMYLVIGTSIHTETREELVLYRAMNDERIWARPKDMFFSKVPEDKNSSQEYRFELVMKGSNQVVVDDNKIGTCNIKGDPLNKPPTTKSRK